MTTATIPLVSYGARYTMQVAMELGIQAPEGTSVEDLDKLFFQEALKVSIGETEDPDTIFFELYDEDGNEIT